MVNIFLLGTFIKMLLIPAYRSTDFEVHRNWLAITRTLPLKDWYFDETSEWTLDYPPFFAYFEWFLSIFAEMYDSDITKLSNLNYSENSVVIFQRFSVIISDFLLWWATWRFCTAAKLTSNGTIIVMLAVVMNAGLLLIDHIHFQYNGFLLSFLILCCDLAIRGQGLLLALSFSCLVLMKHLYLLLSPVFATFLLATHCFTPFSLSLSLSSVLSLSLSSPLTLLAVCSLN